MPKTHNATKDGPPPKKQKKNTTPTAAPVDVSKPPAFSPELMKQMIQALEEKQSAEKKSAEKAKKKTSTPKKKLGKTPPKPSVSAEEVWADDSDGENQQIKPMKSLNSIGENDAVIGNLNENENFFDATAELITTGNAGVQGIPPQTFGTVEKITPSGSESQSGTKNDDKSEDGPEEDSKDDEKTKLNKEMASGKAKINANIKKLHLAIEKQGKRNEDFKGEHLKLKACGEENNSSELLTFRKNFLNMMAKFQDKLADITWEEEYEVKNHLTKEMETNTRTESALHTLAQFLRTAANYVDSKNVAAETVKAEIKDLRAKYKLARAKKAELEDEEWDLQATEEVA